MAACGSVTMRVVQRAGCAVAWTSSKPAVRQSGVAAAGQRPAADWLDSPLGVRVKLEPSLLRTGTRGTIKSLEAPKHLETLTALVSKQLQCER